MSVVMKASSPYHQIEFSLFGEKFRCSSGTKVKSVAKSMEREWRSQVHAAHAAGQHLPGTTTTMDVAAGIYWQGLTSAKQTRTLAQQMAEVIGLIGPDTPITNINMLMMDAIMADFRERPNRRDPNQKIGDASANVVPDIVSRVLNKAKKALRIKLPDQPARWEHYVYTDERIRELSYKEEIRLSQKAPNELWWPCQFMIELGLRRTNCVTLRWDQINWETMMICVRQKGGQLHHIQISGPAAEILEIQRKKMNFDPEFVFTYTARKRTVRKGKVYQAGDRVPWSPANFSTRMRELFELIGIENFVVHDFRHTCATRLLRVSNIEVVRKLLGHITERMSRRYTKLVENDVRGPQMAKHVMDVAQRQHAQTTPDGSDRHGDFAAKTVAAAHATRLLEERNLREMVQEPLRLLSQAA
jgi:integrase